MHIVYNTPQRWRKSPEELKSMDLLLQKATTLPEYGTLRFTSPFHQAMLCYCLEYFSHSQVKLCLPCVCVCVCGLTDMLTYFYAYSFSCELCPGFFRNPLRPPAPLHDPSIRVG